jgi:hypothetical protein
MTHPYTVPSESSFALHRETERSLPLVLINHCVYNECRCRDLATTAVITLPIGGELLSRPSSPLLLFYYFVVQSGLCPRSSRKVYTTAPPRVRTATAAVHAVHHDL